MIHRSTLQQLRRRRAQGPYQSLETLVQRPSKDDQ